MRPYPDARMVLTHGTCVEIGGVGILLRGPPGSGKSDLALRLIDRGARLVADDQTELRRDGAAVVASAPSAIAGLIEIRGFGIFEVPRAPSTPIALVVDLVPAEEVERMPEPTWCGYLDCRLPLMRLAPFEASAGAKLRAALRAVAASGRPV